MTSTQPRVEAAMAIALARLGHLQRSGVFTGAQMARIAGRVAADRGAEIGALKAQTLVDLTVDQSGV